MSQNEAENSQRGFSYNPDTAGGPGVAGKKFVFLLMFTCYFYRKAVAVPKGDPGWAASLWDRSPAKLQGVQVSEG